MSDQPTMRQSNQEKIDAVRSILARRLVAVLRFSSGEECRNAAEAVAAGGITILEVTLTTPGALEIIASLAGRADVVVGVGSVRTTDDVARSADAGASFMASPIADLAVLAEARSRGMATMPGALTPTEILGAWEARGDIIKVFPMPSDGPAYIRAVLGPLPDIRLAPSGGVTPQSARAYLEAGASALNVGTWLTHDSGRAASPKTLRARAEELVATVKGVVV